jgi:carboxypeptidase Taq
MQRLLGVEVRSAAEGVLQDVHWGAGLIGYFPTYTLGNLVSAQLWEQMRREAPDVDERIEQGDFAPLRGWLREHVHRHGRTFDMREIVRRVTGEELRVDPLVEHLSRRLREAGLLDERVFD